MKQEDRGLGGAARMPIEYLQTFDIDCSVKGFVSRALHLSLPVVRV